MRLPVTVAVINERNENRGELLDPTPGIVNRAYMELAQNTPGKTCMKRQIVEVPKPEQ
jgi:hypothetical protein